MNEAEAGALALVERLRQSGFEAYWVGGCVRDRLMNRPCKDIDIATNARPEAVLRLFPTGRPVGRAFGVILIPDAGGRMLEVATFREDHGIHDGRHPGSVTFSDAPADARRRDFTINALFMDPVTGEVLDYVGGRADIARRLLRTVGDPMQRFAEDYLRLLRAVRFAATLELKIDPATEAALRAHAGRIGQISAERVRMELTRLLLEAPRAGEGVALLDRMGLLAVLLPEVKALQGVEQPPQFHPEGDVWTHTLMMLDRMQTEDPVLAWAVWLHDIGKPPTAACIDGRWRFEKHAVVGAQMADAVLRRLRFPNRQREAITDCIRSHMRFADVPQMRPARLRCWMAEPLFPVELELHRLDCMASHGKTDSLKRIEALADEWSRQQPLPAHWIRGNDLLALGLPPGPGIGDWLKKAFAAQLNGTFQNRDELLQWLRDCLAAETDAEK